MAEINQVKSTIMHKIITFLAKLFKIQIVPQEVTDNDSYLMSWWQIYRCQASWIDQTYVTVDGMKRNRKRLQLGMGKVVCAEVAGLVLAEEPDVAAGDLVAEVIKREKLWANLRRTLEYQASLGGQAIKVLIGKGENGTEIGLDFVKAQNFIPLSWDNAQVTEGMFIDRRIVGGKALIRVETHRKARPDENNPDAPQSGYVITSQAFDEQSGLEVPLSSFDPDISPQEVIQIDRPLFVYIANPEANNINPEAPTGISIFANATDTIKALDIAFDQFYSEIELGGRRIALPGSVFKKANELQDDGTVKRVSYFDPTDRVYIRLEGDDAEKFKPTEMTADIRADQFKTSIQALLNIFAMQTGFDPGYFSFDGVSVKTATEVISENSHTYKTIAAMRENLDKGLKYIFDVINELGAIYKINGALKDPASITWDDSVIEDRNTRAKYYEDLYNSKLIDLETALRKIHGLSDKDAAKMAQKIRDENKTVGADAIFGVGN